MNKRSKKYITIFILGVIGAIISLFIPIGGGVNLWRYFNDPFFQFLGGVFGQGPIIPCKVAFFICIGISVISILLWAFNKNEE